MGSFEVMSLDRALEILTATPSGDPLVEAAVEAAKPAAKRVAEQYFGFETEVPFSQNPQSVFLEVTSTGTGERYYVLYVSELEGGWKVLVRRHNDCLNGWSALTLEALEALIVEHFTEETARPMRLVGGSNGHCKIVPLPRSV